MKRLAWMSASVLAGSITIAAGCSDSGGAAGDGDTGDGDVGDGDAAGDGDTGDGDGDTSDGDGDTGDGDGNVGDGDGDAVATGDPLYGAFVVLLTAANESTGNDAFASFQGNVRTATLVESIEWDFVREEGECQLLVPVFPFCDPACESGMVCVAGDMCIPEAQPVNIGPVNVSGLMTEEGASEFSISPVGSKSNYLPPASITLAYPPAEDGAAVTLSGEIEGAPLTIETSGIAPLSIDMEEVPIGGDEDAIVTWGAPGSDSQSEMELLVDISYHGGVKGKVICNTADDGEHAIPASILNDLIDLGVAGFPTITFHRVARGASSAPHEIEFRVEQNVQIPVAIDGLVSCTFPEDCPEGETCQVDRSCR
jgi:hypothetical protein